ncbi:MAG: hypothetical protein HQ521_20565 [Bacteroidetes bacterium]|nr:hypothetical protein [Bacteroidota bacterium]
MLTLEAWLKLIVGFASIVLLKSYDLGFVWLLSTSITSTIVAMITIVVIWIEGGSIIKFPFNLLKKELWNYSWPISIATGLQWFQSSGWRLVVERFGSIELVGMISIAVSYGASLMAASHQVLDQINLPQLYRKYNNSITHKDKNHQWRQYAIYMIKLLSICSVIISIISPAIFLVATNKVYHSVALLVSIFTFTEFTRIICSIYQQRYFLQKDTREMIIPFVGSAIMSVVFSYYGIIQFGAAGLTIGLLLSGGITALLFDYLMPADFRLVLRKYTWKNCS